MHEQVSLPYLIQRALETLHEIRGQLTDKTDGISQKERQIVDGHLTNCRVEGGKEFVLCKHLTLGEQVHHRTLAHVGIAHKGDTDQAPAVLPLGGLLLVNLSQTLFQQGDTLQDDTTVHLQLGLTRSTQTYRAFSTTRTGTTSLTFQVGPESLQAGQHITMLCQFYLCLCLSRLCPHGEDIQNQ